MWMAEGFLQPSNGNSTLEEVGCRYMDDLTSRSFFQPSLEKQHFDSVKSKRTFECFHMHDLIHELATHVAGDFYFRLEESIDKIPNKTHHLSCNFQNYPDQKVFQKLKGLRTFIGLDFSSIPRSIGTASSKFISSDLKCLRTLSLQNLSALEQVPKLIGNFIHLRYLNLAGTSIAKLPDSICKLYNLHTLELYGTSLEKLPSEMGDLVNLRYLDLSCLNIVSLPDSLHKLSNLQTLRLEKCCFLRTLPSKMEYLKNLRHLDISGTCLTKMPSGLGNLKALQFLSNFIVGKEQETAIGVLGGFSDLKRCIHITKLENVKSKNEASDARMKEKKHIKDLTLSWSTDGDLKDSPTTIDILAELEPQLDLEKLKIEGYRGKTFPEWLGYSSYQNMTSLGLNRCVNCHSLPPLGKLPALKELIVGGLESVEIIDDELLWDKSYVSTIPFPCLEILKFEGMTSWKEWRPTKMKAFPKLLELTISNCKNLTGYVPWPFRTVKISGTDRLLLHPDSRNIPISNN